jgi:hypothetical protein
VPHARGKYLGLFNDDTIASPELLAEHWKAHQGRPDMRQCVLEDFRFPPAAQDRALTRFLTQKPFLFPQVMLKAGEYWEYTYVVTCNLSVKRDAVLAAGSFDALPRGGGFGSRTAIKPQGIFRPLRSRSASDSSASSVYDSGPDTTSDNLWRESAGFFAEASSAAGGRENFFWECWTMRRRTDGAHR